MSQDTATPSDGELDAIDALVTNEICSRVADAQREIDELTERATALVGDVEQAYSSGRAIDAAHEELLHPLYPGGDVPLDHDQRLYELTGQEKLFRDTHNLLRILHNAVPNYPHMTIGEEGKLR